MHTESKLKLEDAKPYVIVLLLRAVWVVAAALRPETTMHLGPVLLPLAPLMVTDRSTNGVIPVLFGVFIGFVVLGALGVLGMLEGPAFTPFDSAVAESVFALFAAGTAGVLFARLARRGMDQCV